MPTHPQDVSLSWQCKSTNFAYSQLIFTYFLAYFGLGLSTDLSTNPSNVLIILKPNGQAAQAKQL
jgi:hypothetical protein